MLTIWCGFKILEIDGDTLTYAAFCSLAALTVKPIYNPILLTEFREDSHDLRAECFYEPKTIPVRQ